MATSAGEFSDNLSVRIAFLRAVVAALPPIRAADLRVAGLDRRAIQKRIERLRREAGGPSASDEELVAYARGRLAELSGPVPRAVARLASLGRPLAQRFARAAGLQSPVIDDWIELARSPGDRGWSRDQIDVRELAARSVLARGPLQSWMTEKKRYLRRCWDTATPDADLRRNLVPNQLKMDLVELSGAGTEDAPLCAVKVAPVDWLTCFALNSRLDEPTLSGDGRTVRQRWGDPVPVTERRALPGMLVAHIVVETSDRRLLVCQRQRAGLQDEPGTWSLSIEERWSARLHDLRSRDGRLLQSARVADQHPHDVVKRGIREELGVEVDERDIRVLSWGLEASVLYPGFIAIACTGLGSWQVEGLRAQAADPNEVRFVSSVPAEVESIELITSEAFTPVRRPQLRARWHRTAKARLLATLAHIAEREDAGGRQAVLARFGRV